MLKSTEEVCEIHKHHGEIAMKVILLAVRKAEGKIRKAEVKHKGAFQSQWKRNKQGRE